MSKASAPLAICPTRDRYAAEAARREGCCSCPFQLQDLERGSVSTYTSMQKPYEHHSICAETCFTPLSQSYLSGQHNRYGPRQAPGSNPTSPPLQFSQDCFRPFKPSPITTKISSYNVTEPSYNYHNGRKSRRQPEQWWARWYWRQAQRSCWGRQYQYKCPGLH